MFRNIKYKYYNWRINQAQESMDLTRGIIGGVYTMMSEEELAKTGNISFNISKAKRDYFRIRLQFIR